MKRRSPYRALYTTSLVRTIRRRVKKLLLPDNDLLLLLFSDGFLMWETQHVASLTMVYSRLPKLSLISSRQVCARKRAVTPTVFKWTGEIMYDLTERRSARIKISRQRSYYRSYRSHCKLVVSF